MYLYDKDILVQIKSDSQIVDRLRASGRRSRNWRPGSVSREPLAPVKLLRQRLWRPSNDWSGRYSVGVLLEKDSFLSSILLQQTHRAGDTPVAWCLMYVSLGIISASCRQQRFYLLSGTSRRQRFYFLSVTGRRWELCLLSVTGHRQRFYLLLVTGYRQ